MAALLKDKLSAQAGSISLVLNIFSCEQLAWHKIVSLLQHSEKNLSKSRGAFCEEFLLCLCGFSKRL